MFPLYSQLLGGRNTLTLKCEGGGWRLGWQLPQFSPTKKKITQLPQVAPQPQNYFSSSSDGRNRSLNALAKETSHLLDVLLLYMQLWTSRNSIVWSCFRFAQRRLVSVSVSVTISDHTSSVEPVYFTSPKLLIQRIKFLGSTLCNPYIAWNT